MNLILPKGSFSLRRMMMENEFPINYEQFQTVVANLLYDEKNFKFLGAGADSRVFKINLPIGDFAVKVAKEGATNIRGKVMGRSTMTLRKIESGIQGIGISGIEQLASGSTDDYVAIYDLAKGNVAYSMTEEDLDYVTKAQKERLLESIKMATDAGLAFDGANPSGANAFYDRNEGFTLIDYSIPYWDMTFDENWSAAIRSLGPTALRAFAPPM